jgi:beta-lactam-binding protein with PASTA domain
MLKNWLFNIGLGVITLATLSWLGFVFLGMYTRHNQFVEVPNLKGVDIQEAALKISEAGLRFEITDSVYSEEIKKGAITEQDPRPGDKVKPNRIIYVVLNGLDKPKVKMPMLVDQSLTLAKAILKSNGLVLGNVVFQPNDIGNNLVLAQSMNGHEIPAGKMIIKGSVVDLVVAKNEFQETTSDSTESENNNSDKKDEQDIKKPKKEEPSKAEKKRKKKKKNNN